MNRDSKVAATAWAAVFYFVVSPAPAQDELRDPGWNDAYFEAYRAALTDGSLAGPAGPGAGPAEGGVIYTLPVFGILGTEEAPGAGAGPIPALDERVQNWPACAETVPTITTIPETAEQSAGLPPGSWYVRTFDFGCIQIVLEGTRNEPDPSAAPSAAPLQESGTIEINYHDENAGDTFDIEGNVVEPVDATAGPFAEDRGTPILTVTFGNLPYSLRVECTAPESRDFCNSEVGLRALAKQLIVVAGSPTN